MNKIYLYGGLIVLLSGVLALVWWLSSRSGALGVVLSEDLEKKLDQLNPSAKQKFRAAVYQAEQKTGWKIIIPFDPYRTFAKQNQLYNDGITTAKAGRSYHNYGLAIDINATKNGKSLRMASPKQDWLNSGIPQIFENLGFTWGGRWSGYYDPVHLDLRKEYNLDSLYNKALALSGGDWSKIEGNRISL